MELKNLISDGEKVQVYECDGKSVKVFKDPDEPKSVVLYEALTHTRIEETGYSRIPEFEEITRVKGSDGIYRWAIVYRFIEGCTLAEMMEKHPENIDSYLEQLAELQLGINSLRSAKLSRLNDYLKRSIENLDVIDDVKKYELLSRLEAMPKHIKVCHGDLSPDNIIVNDSGMYVVDWLKAKQGNASADVAKTYLSLCLSHHTEFAEKYLRAYCKKSGTDRKYIQRWLPIVAAAQLKFRRPEERELLLTWIDVVDFI